MGIGCDEQTPLAMDRHRPRTGDAVWIEGCDPAWYKPHERGKYMNAEVISVDGDDVLVRHFDYYNHGQETYDRHLFETKHYDPGEQQGFWIVVF